jgi:hypothetical protein
MAMRLSALCAGRHLPPGRFLLLISVRSWGDPRAIVRLEGLGKLKNSVTSSRIEPATQCLKQVGYRAPPNLWISEHKCVACWLNKFCWNFISIEELYLLGYITPLLPWIWTDVSEQHVVTIARIEDYAKQETIMKEVGRRVHASCLRDGKLVGLFFDPEDGGDIFLRNMCWFSVDLTPLWEQQTLHLLVFLAWLIHKG